MAKPSVKYVLLFDYSSAYAVLVEDHGPGQRMTKISEAVIWRIAIPVSEQMAGHEIEIRMCPYDRFYRDGESFSDWMERIIANDYELTWQEEEAELIDKCFLDEYYYD